MSLEQNGDGWIIAGEYQVSNEFVDEVLTIYDGASGPINIDGWTLTAAGDSVRITREGDTYLIPFDEIDNW